LKWTYSEERMNLAVVAAFIAAALEYPLAVRYPTTPSTGTLTRMAVVGGVAFVSVLVAQRLAKKETP
jgi:hypothetical protein